MDGDPGVLVQIRPALGRDRVLLPRAWPPSLDVAVLDDHGRVAEDEVHRAGDVVLRVELAVGVHVQGVLVRLDGALVHDGEVATDAQRNGLALPWPGAVDDGEARVFHTGNKKIPEVTEKRVSRIYRKIFRFAVVLSDEI